MVILAPPMVIKVLGIPMWITLSWVKTSLPLDPEDTPDSEPHRIHPTPVNFSKTAAYSSDVITPQNQINSS